jgi:hypothetical protein
MNFQIHNADSKIRKFERKEVLQANSKKIKLFPINLKNYRHQKNVIRTEGQILEEHGRLVKKNFLDEMNSEKRKILGRRMHQEINTELSDLQHMVRSFCPTILLF